MMRPVGRDAWAIQRRREPILRSAGAKTVPIFSPESRRRRTSGVRALAMTATSPALTTMRAASSFVAIPPEPRELFSLVASDIAASSTCSITSRTLPSSITPSTLVRNTSRSAESMLATSAARTSLSPNRISSTATVSFSLMIAIASHSSSEVSVLRMLRYRVRSSKSSRVSSTWAIFTSCCANASWKVRISSPCPTAATAWSLGMVLGRVRRSSSPIPAPIAPLVTSVTEIPRALTVTICSVRELITPRSSRPESPQIALLPILTTIRLVCSRIRFLVRAAGMVILESPPSLSHLR